MNVFENFFGIQRRHTIFSDGGTVGFNGKLGSVEKVAIAFFIKEKGIKKSKVCQGGSNNEAEFMALIWGMEEAIKMGIKKVKFLMDSKIVANRANGHLPTGKFWNERMNAFQEKVLELATQFEEVKFKWIPREANRVADTLTYRAKMEYFNQQQNAGRAHRKPEN